MNHRGPIIGLRAMTLKDQAVGLVQAVTDRKVHDIGSPGSGVRIKLISEGTVDLKVRGIVIDLKAESIEDNTPVKG